MNETIVTTNAPTEIPGQDPGGRIKFKRMLTDEGHVEELVEMHSVVPVAVENRENQTRDALRRTEEFQKRAQESYDAIDYLMRNIAGPIADYEELVKGALTRVREQKMALQNETRGLMSALREVREFFLEDKHEEEVRRLLEFVELCERLKRLKDSGFLDSVADTMLRL